MHRFLIAVGVVIATTVVFFWPGGSTSPAQSVTVIAPDVGNTPTTPPINPPDTATTSSLPARLTNLGDTRTLLASVKASVLRAQAGAPIPAHSRPMVTPTLASQVADLGACDYGVPHSNAGGALCPRGDVDADRTIVVLGDSHGRHWVPAIDRIAVAHHWKAYYLVKQQCTASLVPTGDPALSAPAGQWQACKMFRRWTMNLIKRLHPDVVIVSTSVPSGGVFTGHGFTEDPRQQVGAFAQGFRELWTRLHEATDARLVLLRDVPARLRGTSPETCLTGRATSQRTCLSPESAPELLPRIHLVDAAVRTARRAGVDVVDPRPWFCWDGECPALIGHYLPYRNSAHITVDYSRHLAGPLAEALGI